jgi:TPR repeat protein
MRDEDGPTVPEPALANRDVQRLRDSVKKLAGDDTFGGRFTLIGEAGSGGMGVVYEAKDRDSGRRVAIKIITGLAGPNERARFAAEAEVLERLDHPAIVDYVDHGLTADGEPYIAMEWLVGESLATRLERGRLSVAETAILGARIADALVHAHANGVVHRDLKPSNVLLVEGKLEEAHLIDFGVAKHGDRDLTHTGQMIGTPGYMAPEQVRGDKSVGASADLFALGCVLYKALTTRDAFSGAEVMEVLARLLLEDPPLVESLAPDVPPRLAHLIGSLLSKDPKKRLSDAALVSSELRAIQSALAAHDTSELALRPDEVPTPALQANLRARPPLWIVLIASSALLVAIVTLVIVFVARDADPDVARCDATEKAGCQSRCDANDAPACHLLAVALHAKSDHEGARLADARACRLGENRGCYFGADSLIKTAKRYEVGDQRRVGLLAEAERLLQTGCERGDSESCRELGKQVSKSVGLFAPDPVKSFALVEKACVANNVKACTALARMVADPDNGATPEMRAHATEVRNAACARLADLDCGR